MTRPKQGLSSLALGGGERETLGTRLSETNSENSASFVAEIKLPTFPIALRCTHLFFSNSLSRERKLFTKSKVVYVLLIFKTNERINF